MASVYDFAQIIVYQEIIQIIRFWIILRQILFVGKYASFEMYSK